TCARPSAVRTHGPCFGLAAAGPLRSTFSTAPSGPKVIVARDASGTSPRHARAAGRTRVIAFATALPDGRSGRGSDPRVVACVTAAGGASAGGSGAVGGPAASRSAEASALVGAGPVGGGGAAGTARCAFGARVRVAFATIGETRAGDRPRRGGVMSSS